MSDKNFHLQIKLCWQITKVHAIFLDVVNLSRFLSSFLVSQSFLFTVLSFRSNSKFQSKFQIPNLISFRLFTNFLALCNLPASGWALAGSAERARLSYCWECWENSCWQPKIGKIFMHRRIQMQHCRIKATDGLEFWISCKRPAFHSSFSLLQVIQNKRPWCWDAAYVTAGW